LFPTGSPPPLPELPPQQIGNQNNKPTQDTYNIEFSNSPNYVLTLMECEDLHMRSGRIFNNTTSPIIIEDDIEENPIGYNSVEIQPVVDPPTTPQVTFPGNSKQPQPRVSNFLPI
jgi:hypothetical protein